LINCTSSFNTVDQGSQSLFLRRGWLAAYFPK
jgi:hypothetical protein